MSKCARDRERLEGRIAELEAERDDVMKAWLDRIAELEANLRYTAETWAKRCARLDGEYMRLLKAFAAYRSALRSGEPESPELTALGEEALSSRRVPGE